MVNIGGWAFRNKKELLESNSRNYKGFSDQFPCGELFLNIMINEGIDKRNWCL